MGESHHNATEHTKFMDSHRQTYASFVKTTVASVLGCLYILVALAAVAFSPWGTLICWATLIVGFVTILIDAKAGERWVLSGGGLAVMALITVVNA